MDGLRSGPEARPVSAGVAPAAEALRLVRGLALAGLGVAALLALPLLALRFVRAEAPALALLEARCAGILALPLAAVLLAEAGLLGTWPIAWARRRALLPPCPAAPRRRRLALPSLPAAGDPRLVGRMARWPQVALVALPASAAVALAWMLRPLDIAPLVPPSAAYALAGGAVVLAFLLLLAERTLAAEPPARLPEAPALRALAFLATLATFATGLLEIGSGLGLPWMRPAGRIVALVLALAGAELALRALGRMFLPPPPAESARAATDSALARLLSETAQADGGIAAPIRRHLGIDFSRSWALAYVRAASLPLLLFLVLLAWGLSGVILLPLDQRAVYQRFGAPVRVLHPGLHAILPWPLGSVRRIEFGTVHELALVTGEEAAAAPRVGAEAAPPAAADRLWEQAHPGEVEFLIASQSRGRQSFQAVSADLRVLYRIGPTDEDARDAAYAVADPENLVRAASGRVAAGFFAGRTLDAVLGGNREAIAEGMRARLQAMLDAAHSGLRAVAVVIEAIHPPAAAADAYHAVQAAEIDASASIAAERGRAVAALAGAQQYAAEQVAAAAGLAAETTGEAAADLTRFTADRAADRTGAASFRLERYLAALSGALGDAPMTILDSRIPAPDAPVLDLRPPGAFARTGPAGE